jgi:hypothetical protein
MAIKVKYFTLNPCSVCEAIKLEKVLDEYAKNGKIELEYFLWDKAGGVTEMPAAMQSEMDGYGSIFFPLLVINDRIYEGSNFTNAENKLVEADAHAILIAILADYLNDGGTLGAIEVLTQKIEDTVPPSLKDGKWKTILLVLFLLILLAGTGLATKKYWYKPK